VVPVSFTPSVAEIKANRQLKNMKTPSSTVVLTLVSAILLVLAHICTSAPHARQHYHHHELLARTAALSATTTTTTMTTTTYRTAPSSSFSSSGPPLDGYYGTYLAGTAFPCSGTACATARPSSSPSPSSPIFCVATTTTNNTSFGPYAIICDVDFVGQNIYPFVLASSFEACLAQCDQFNLKHAHTGSTRCAGFVYAPGRVNASDDCYLKSSLNSAVPATISLIGATLGTLTGTAISVSSTAGTSKAPTFHFAPNKR
jgi:hypothetical protein